MFGSSFLKASQGFNTTARIGIIFLIDLAIGQRPLSQHLKASIFIFTEFLTFAVNINTFDFGPGSLISLLKSSLQIGNAPKVQTNHKAILMCSSQRICGS